MDTKFDIENGLSRGPQAPETRQRCKKLYRRVRHPITDKIKFTSGMQRRILQNRICAHCHPNGSRTFRPALVCRFWFSQRVNDCAYVFGVYFSRCYFFFLLLFCSLPRLCLCRRMRSFSFAEHFRACTFFFCVTQFFRRRRRRFCCCLPLLVVVVLT